MNLRKGISISAKAKRRLFWTLGIFTTLFLILFAFSFTSAAVNFYRLDGEYDPSVVQVMDKTRREGELADNPTTKILFRSSEFKTVQFGEPSHPFEFYVATAPTVRDFLCFKTDYMTEEFRMSVALYVEGPSYSADDNACYYHLEILADDLEGQPFVVDGTTFSPKGWFHTSRDRTSSHLDEDGGIDEADKKLAPALVDRFIDAGLATIPFFWENLETAAPSLGIIDLDAFLTSAGDGAAKTFDFVLLNSLFSILFGTLGGVMFVVFLAILGARLYAGKRVDLIEENEELIPSPVPEEPLPEATPEEGEKPLPELVDGVDKKVAEVAKKARLRPVLGEWVIRGVGLGLIFVYGVFMGLYKINDNQRFGPEWNAFFAGANDYFVALSACGTFLLTITVIHIIAENRRGLFKKAIFFFALGFGYYMLMTVFFCLADLTVGTSRFSSVLLLALLYLLPGNLAMGLGIFCFVGFFLFASPDKRFIKRRTFRLLSLVPASLAVASLVSSALMKSGIAIPPYWIANLFFIRDPSFLLVGLGYEYLLFGIRTQYKRYYGDKVDAMEALPEVQMVKNIALCGMVILFNIIFYCIPYEARTNVGFLSPITVTLATLPLLLFQKHLTPNRSDKWDTLYYLLVILFTMLPTILSAVWSLGAGA